MAICPECKTEIPDSATTCPNCGKRVIRGDSLASVPGKITLWQKIVIAVSIIILIIIGLTFQHAEERENRAAQINFTEPVETIIGAAASQSGLGKKFGLPAYNLKAETKYAEIFLEFPRGPLTNEQASLFAMAVCGSLARAYVAKGYMPRHLTVHIASASPNKIYYGQAVFDGDKGDLFWQPASQ